MHDLRLDVRYASSMHAPSPALQDLRRKIVRNIIFLSLLVILAGVFAGWLWFGGQLTASRRLDSTLTILFGLYISSQPAANMLELLLFMPAGSREGLVSTSYGRLWLLINILAMVAAWGVIFTGILHFVERAAGFLYQSLML